jgi:hypothetical protein
MEDLKKLLLESKGKLKPSTPFFAELLVNELGGTSKVARIADTAAASVDSWKLRGIPGWRLEYFKVAFPDLRAWDFLGNK